MKNPILLSERTAYVELWRVLVWPCCIALVTLGTATLVCRMDFNAAMATASLTAAGLIALRMLVQVAPQFTPGEWYLVSVSTALLFWCWCGAAGHYFAESLELPALRLLGFVLPPLALIHYLTQPAGEDQPAHEALREANPRQFLKDVTRRWNPRDRNSDTLLPHISFAGLQLPMEAIRKYNLLIVGAQGSGKTTILKQCMQSVISQISPNRRLRAVVYDASTELVSFIDAVKQDGTPTYIMNPYDRRAYSWDVAADVRTLQDASSIANALVPPRTGTAENVYFTHMSRLLTTSAILGLARTRGKEWDLADVVFSVLDKSWWKPVLRQTRIGRLVLDNLGSDDTNKNVVSAVLSFFERLIPIVALMRRHAAADRKLSITSWNQTASVLILGHGENKEDPVSSLNRILIDRLHRQLLSFHTNPASDDNRTFLFLDEFAQFGPVDAIRTLTRTGRKYGVSTALAFQTINDLRSAYERDSDWQSLIGQIGNKLCLRMHDDPTAEWAAKEIGTRPVEPAKQVSTDATTGRKNVTQIEGGPPQYDFVIHPSRFRTLPLVDGVGVYGFARFGMSLKVPAIHVPWEEVISFPASDEPDFIEAPDEWQEIDEEPLEQPTEHHVRVSDAASDDHFHALMESLTSFSEEIKQSADGDFNRDEENR